MYFRSSIRRNPATNTIGGYYRLVETYRNEIGRICHRTLHTVGFIDFEVEKLIEIQRILNDRLNRKTSLFEPSDPQVIAMADAYWHEMADKKKIDASDTTFEKSKRMIDADSIKLKNAREIGAEWMSYQGLEQLQIKEKLTSLGWKEENIQLALTQIISRAIYPFSEYRTSRWIKENSGICEVTGYNLDKITKDKLYKSALDLYQIKDQLEQHLSKRTNELFDLQDKIILYDLTNTYFEGQKKNSKLAKFGRSKEKRSDAKLIVLALVINVEGFIKYSNVFEGNRSDSSSLPQIIDKIRVKTSQEKRAIVVLDAGIASDENLALIQAKGYDYVCVSRAKVKDYTLDDPSKNIKAVAKNQDIISLDKVTSKSITDYVLRIKSPGKFAKERSMKNQFEERFFMEIEKIKTSLTKKNGVKKSDKVNQRLGRAIEKHPSVAKWYDIEIKSKNNIALEVMVNKKDNYQQVEDNLGVYFIRTTLKTEDEKTIWTVYNTIREIESSFRTLKTDLDLRPIYHKNDDATLAHLHLGLLAYWLVNTIRHQLKSKGIKHSWQEIIRITNTQKVVTTSGQNKYDEVIYIRRCTEPTEKVKSIYQALGYRNYPFVKRKDVLHKPKLKNYENQCLWVNGFG